MFCQDSYKKALNFASSYHKEQKTSKNLPYISYLSLVAMEVIHAIASSKLEEKKANLAISVALLHKTLEKTDCTYDRLYSKFGEEVANGIEALTKDLSIESSKLQLQNRIENLLASSYEVQMVELARYIVLLESPIATWDKEKINSFYKEARFVLSCLKNSNIYLSKRLEEKINDYTKYIN